jgi:hypothetical protein
MIEAASISEMSVNFYQTALSNNPEVILAAVRTSNLTLYSVIKNKYKLSKIYFTKTTENVHRSVSYILQK